MGTEISVLIPIYNRDCRELVNVLHQQASAVAELTFEILCIDDASTDPITKNLNQELSGLRFVRLVWLETNLGRAKIRNLLAKEAAYSQLLFMDCDSLPISAAYVQNYAVYLHPENQQIIYGGTYYPKEAPENVDLRLHWKNGFYREQKPAQERNRHPYKSFTPNNFACPKSLFERIRFDESILQYGHEDTLFGIHLRAQEVKILHIDNPLNHLGLEPKEVFLRKTRQAVENLYLLHLENNLGEEIRLLNAFLWLQKYKLTWVVGWMFRLLQAGMEWLLGMKNPSLRVLDLYKLGCMCWVSVRSK